MTFFFCAQGGEPDVMTAAKMVLHDWQRGRIPFFVPPPKIDDNGREDDNDVGGEEEDAGDNAVAARRAIADVISSQQLNDVPVQTDLYSESELLGETSENPEKLLPENES